jgi:ribosomal protein L20
MAVARTRFASRFRPSKRLANTRIATARRRSAASAHLWIQRINAAVRVEGLTYGQFMHGCKLAGVELDRKILADLAMNEAGAFSVIVAQAKAALPQAA